MSNVAVSKTTFGEGYLLTVVKKGPWTCSVDHLVHTIQQCLPTACLKVTKQFKTSPTAANTKEEITSEQQSTTTGKVNPIERRDTDVRLHANEALAIIMKRLILIIEIGVG